MNAQIRQDTDKYLHTFTKFIHKPKSQPPWRLLHPGSKFEQAMISQRHFGQDIDQIKIKTHSQTLHSLCNYLYTGCALTQCLCLLVQLWNQAIIILISSACAFIVIVNIRISFSFIIPFHQFCKWREGIKFRKQISYTLKCTLNSHWITFWK